MSDAVTKQDFKELRTEMQETAADIRTEMRDTSTEIRTEMRSMFEDMANVMDVMMTRIDERFTNLETALAKQQKDIQQILIRLDHIDKQLEINEQERLILGHQLERLDKWVHELADKINYNLSTP